jgi:hypothetical protein
MIQYFYNWKSARIEHVCNSESALNRIWNKEKYGVFDQSIPDADDITAARTLLSAIKNTQVSPQWVQGHADKRGQPYKPQEETNTQTDILTGKAHTNLPP